MMKNLSRVISVALALALILVVLPVTAPAYAAETGGVVSNVRSLFTKDAITIYIIRYILDVVDIPVPPPPEKPSGWAEARVNEAITAGIVPQQLQSNYTDEITRAEFCALAVAIYEGYTGEAITERVTFSDTTDVSVEKAAGAGIVGGDDGKFDPYSTFNREMAAVLLVNLLKALDIELDASDVAFTDKGDISFWALEQVGQAQAAGLVSGNAGKYDPKGKFTRELGIILMLNLWEFLL